MKSTQIAAVTGALVLLFAAGCQRDESKPPAPKTPAPATTAPTPPAATAPAPGTGTTAPGDAGRTVGQTVDDATINAKVKAALLQADDVKGTDINVDTVNGTVTLKGAVQSQAQSDRAVTIAKGIEGVKQVQNTLSVKAMK